MISATAGSPRARHRRSSSTLSQTAVHPSCPVGISATSTSATCTSSSTLHLPPPFLAPSTLDEVHCFEDIYRFRFTSFKDAFGFGQRVARKLGYSVRVNSTGKSKREGVVRKYVCCSRNGSRDNPGQGRRRPSQTTHVNNDERDGGVFGSSSPKKKHPVTTGGKTNRCGCPWNAKLRGHVAAPALVADGAEEECWFWEPPETPNNHNHAMEVSRDAILNIGTVIEEEQRSSLTFGSCDASGSTNTLRMELGDAIMSGCGSVQGLPFSGSTAAFDALLMAVDLVHQEEEELERRMESDTKPSTLSQVLSGWQVPIVEGVQQDIVSSNAVPLIQSSSVVNMEMEFTIPDWPKVVTPDID